jgi:hypothetical protein
LEPICELPYGPAAMNGRSEGRTEVSTRLRACILNFLLALRRASTKENGIGHNQPSSRNHSATAPPHTGHSNPPQCGPFPTEQGCESRRFYPEPPRRTTSDVNSETSLDAIAPFCLTQRGQAEKSLKNRASKCTAPVKRICLLLALHVAYSASTAPIRLIGAGRSVEGSVAPGASIAIAKTAS